MAVSLMWVIAVLNDSLITPTNAPPSLEQPVNHISLFGACLLTWKQSGQGWQGSPSDNKTKGMANPITVQGSVMCRSCLTEYDDELNMAIL